MIRADVPRVVRAGSFLLLIGVAMLAARVRAAELIVVDQAGCPYCERFEREIAKAWPNTDVGRDVPLRRVDLHGEWPADLATVKRATLTPTFILIEAGKERGRLLGYAGDEHFWFLIDELLERLGSTPTEQMSARNPRESTSKKQ